MSEITLASAAASETPVTVTRKDGKEFTGTLVDLGDGLFKVVTGLRGRPAVVSADGIESVVAA